MKMNALTSCVSLLRCGVAFVVALSVTSPEGFAAAKPVRHPKSGNLVARSSLAAAPPSPQIIATTLPGEGSTANTAIGAFSITNSTALNASSAGTIANYALTEAGLDGVFGTADDVAFAFSVTVPQAAVVSFNLTQSPLQPGRYRFETKAGLIDGASQPVTTFARSFVVANPTNGRIESSDNNSIPSAAALPMAQTPTGSGLFTALGVGAIAPASDVDFWRFDGEAGDLITIRLEADAANSTQLYLDNSAGSTIAAAGGNGAGVAQIQSFKLTTPGAYYIHVFNNSGVSVYQFRLDQARNLPLELEGNGTQGTANFLSVVPGVNRAQVAGSLPAEDVGGDYFLWGMLNVGNTIHATLTFPDGSSLAAGDTVLTVQAQGSATSLASSTSGSLDYAVTADGIYYVVVQSPSNRNLRSQYLLTESVSDTIAPVITSVTLPAEGVTSNAVSDRFTVNFSEDLAPATVNNVGNLDLRAAGADGVFGTGDDAVYGLASLGYTTGLTVQYRVTDGPLQPGLYRLTVGTGLTDRAGNGLAATYVRNFSVAAQPGYVIEGRSNDTLATATTLSLSPQAEGDGSFRALPVQSLGTSPRYVATGDFNGDGWVDAVLANAGANVTVLLGKGDGTFQSGVNYPTPSAPYAVAVGDVNGDGKPDVVTANYSANNVSVLLGTGTGTFQTAVNYPAGSAPYAVAVGDVSGDGKLDVVTANSGGNNVSVLLGTGAGTFGSAVNYPVGSNPSGVAVGDVNGDGKLDVVAANSSSDYVSVLLGTGTGSFAAAVNYPVGSSPRSVAVGDVNGDGNLDVVAANAGANTVSVLLGSGGGAFGPASNYATNSSDLYQVILADVNGDGRADAIVANYSGQRLGVLLGHADGSLEAATNYATGYYWNAVAAGDFNGDGRVDLLGANGPNNTVTVLLGNGLQPLSEEPAGSGLRTGLAQGNLWSSTDNDYYRFSANAGDVMLIVAESVGSPNASSLNYYLYGPDGSGITAFSGDYNGSGQVAVGALTTTGTYTLRVYTNPTWGHYAGEYHFRVSTVRPPLQLETEPNDTIANANTLTLATAGDTRFASVTGSPKAAGDLDYFKLGTVNPGETIFLTSRIPANSSYNPVVSIYNSANGYVPEAGSGRPFDGVGEMRITTAGTYYAVIRNSSAGVGLADQYLLDVQILPTGSQNFPNLQVVAVTVPVGSGSQSGQAATLSYTVQNVGSVTTPANGWSDRVALSQNSILRDSDDIFVGIFPHTGALSPGSSYTVTQNVVLPEGITGDYHLIVETDASNRVNEFLLEGDNITVSDTTFHINLAPYPDLVIEGLAVGTPDASGEFSIGWQSANRGTAVASGWKERIVITDLAAGNVVQSLGKDVTGPLAPNGTISQQLKFTPQLGGRYSVTVTTDADSAIFEYGGASHAAGEENNTTSTVVAAQVDLRVSGVTITPPQGLQSGGNFTVSWTDTNTGNVPLGSNFYDTVAIRNTTTGEVIFDQTLPYETAAGGVISATGFRDRQLAFRLPDGASGAGSFEVTVTTDGGGAVREYVIGADAETNNAASTNFASALATYPDLQVTGLTVQPTAGPRIESGSSITIAWNDLNSGNAATPGMFVDRLRIVNSTTGQTLIDSSLTYDPAALGNGPILPGALRARSQVATLPNGPTGVGNLLVSVTTEANGHFFEYNSAGTGEANNAATVQVASAAETRGPVLANWKYDIANLMEGFVVTQSSLISVMATDPAGVARVEFYQRPSAGGTDVLIGTDAASQSSFRIFWNAEQTVTNGSYVLTLRAYDTLGNVTVESRGVTVALAPPPPVMTVTFSPTSLVEGATGHATVSLNKPWSETVNIMLGAGEAGRLTFPSAVSIPQGQTSVEFEVRALENSTLEPPISLLLIASSTGLAAAVGSLQITDNDSPAMQLVLDRTVASESGGAQAVHGTITLDRPSTLPLSVQFTADVANQVLLPTSLAIPANTQMVTVPVTILNNIERDGQRQVAITAYLFSSLQAAPMTNSAPAMLTITDDDGPTLTLSVDRSLLIRGSDPAATGTLTRGAAGPEPLEITLVSSAPGVLGLPASVTIPAGETSVVFSLATLSAAPNSGSQPVNVTASAEGWNPAIANLVVTDVAQADLAIEFLSPPTGADSDGWVDVTLRLRNQGLGDAQGPFTQRITLSENPAGTDGVVLAESAIAARFLAGGTIEQTLRVHLPSKPGRYWLAAETDVTGVVTEVLEYNNFTVSPVPIDLAPPYVATLAIVPEKIAGATPIPITGSATLRSGGPAPFVLVNLHITNNGIKRVISAVTDAAGRFTAEFTPLAGEGGTFQFAAGHPGLSTVAVQDEIRVLGLTASPASLDLHINENSSQMVRLTLANLCDVPLTGLRATTATLPTGITVRPAFSSTTLPGNGQVTLDLVVAAGAIVPPSYATVKLIGDDGVKLDVPLALSVIVPQAVLSASPSQLTGAIVPGQPFTWKVALKNNGGVRSSSLKLLVPAAAPWITCSTGQAIPPIDSGATVIMTLLLQPPVDLPLTTYFGNLAVVDEAGQGVSIPYRFRALSEAKGDLRVEVVDEFYYFSAGQPKVTGATVTLVDVTSGEQVAQGITDAKGQAVFPGLRQDYYRIEVVAAGHIFAAGTYFNAGDTPTDIQIFTSRNLVEYTWTVEQHPVEDRYIIHVDTTFETNVPVPVVTVTPETLDISDLKAVGDTKTVLMTVENHGLIAAQTTKFHFGEHPYYTIRPAVESLGQLPAKSSLKVPIVVTRTAVGATPTTLAARNARGRATRDDGDPVPCSISAGVEWGYFCGIIPVWRFSIIIVNGVDGDCGSLPPVPPVRPPPFEPLDPRPVHDQVTVHDPNKETGPGPGPGDPPGGGQTANGGWTIPVVISPAPNLCDCTEGLYCKNLEVKAKLPGILKTLTTRITKILPIQIVDEGANLGASGRLCVTCCPEGGLGFSGEGSGYVSVYVEGLLRKQISFEFEAPAGSEWYGLSASLDAWAGIKVRISGDVNINVRSSTCDDEDELCGSGKVAIEGAVGGEISAKVTAKAMFEGEEQTFSGEVYGRLSLDGHAEAWIRGCYGEDWEAGACADVGGTAVLRGSLKANINGRDVARDITIGGSTTFAKGGECFDDAAARRLGARTTRATRADEISYTVMVPSADLVKTKAETLASLLGQQNGGGVCASVKLRVDQDLVLTRSIISATLDLKNNSPEGITQAGVDVIILDAAGNRANELFSIQQVSGTRLDGTGLVAGQGSLAANWRIVPLETAAPDGPRTYTVGGTLAYQQEGKSAAAQFSPIPITVQPDAALYVKYFHQRDVFSDDPFTPRKEPSVPYSLGVMIENRGAGSAGNLRITSGQPKVLDNEKGLLADFQVIATRVAGQPLTPSLTADFGNLAPHQIKIGEWLFTSSVQGLFTDYRATFEHVTDLGSPRTSLIKEVEIHEMNHQVRALGALDDGAPDFLVNDEADDEDLPDTIYLSDGSVAPVEVVDEALAAGSLSPNQLTLSLTATMPPGWTYLRIPEPSNGQYQLTGVVRSDGLVIPIDVDCWVTDRTFIGQGQRPLEENTLHLVDFDSTGSYTLTYAVKTVIVDQTAPTSRVSPLAAKSAVQFIVSWTGTDDHEFGAFDIFVSVNGGAYTPWLERTNATGALFQGELGKRYSFYSRATDAAGNVEAIPAEPDATTLTSLENTAPVLKAVPDQSVVEAGTFTYQLSATDADGPADQITYSLESEVPPGLTIDRSSGRLSWVTGPTDGGRTISITVKATDLGYPPKSATRTFRLKVVAKNLAPTFAGVAPQRAVVGVPFALTVHAEDSDLPAQILRYGLDGKPPTGLSIDPATGALQWQPASIHAGTTIVVTVVATDNGSPALSSTVKIPISVELPPASFQVGKVTIKAPPMPAAPVLSIPQVFSAQAMGNYAGLLAEQALPDGERGFLTAKITKTGTLTGQVRIFGLRVALKGALTLSGGFTSRIASTQNGSMEVSLNLTKTDAGGWKLVGTVIRTLGAQALVLDCDAQLAGYNGKTEVSPVAGNYTLLLPPNSNDAPEVPHGDGHATVTVNAKGLARAVGMLGDGTKFTQSGLISRDQEWPFFLELYHTKPKGFLAGTIRYRNVPLLSDFDGELRWKRLPQANSPSFAGGFNIARAALGSIYTAPAVGGRALDGFTQEFNNATLILTGGDVPISILPHTLTWDKGDRIFYRGENKVSVKVSRKKGSFAGSFSSKNPPFAATFSGVIFQKQRVMTGTLVRPRTTGAASIEPK